MQEEFMGMILGGIFLLTPIVWILTKHQQKMTQLLNEGRNNQAVAGDQDLRREMSDLRQLVSQQTIALDNLARSQAELKAALVANTDLRERVGS